MDDKISPEDLASLKYFWETKEDLSRWVHFEAKFPALEKQYPEIAAAWRAKVIADRTLTACISQAVYNADLSG